MIVRTDGFAIELTTAFQRHFAEQGTRPSTLPNLTEMGAGTAAEPSVEQPVAAPQRRSARPDRGETTEPLPGFDPGVSPSPTAAADSPQ